MRQAPATHASTSSSLVSTPSLQTRKTALMAAVAALWMLVTAPFRALAFMSRKAAGLEEQTFRSAVGGFVNTQALLLGLAGIVVAIFGPLIGAQLLASLLPSYFSSLSSIFNAFNGVTIANSTLGTTILHSMAILVLLAGIFAPIGLAILVFTIKKSGRSS